MPLSHPPGHAQCDFGEALVIIGGVEQKAHCFVLDLPHSDGCFVKAYPAETTEAFLNGHVSAFAFLGGVPQSILYDNTKLAVARILGDGRLIKNVVGETASGESLPHIIGFSNGLGVADRYSGFHGSRFSLDSEPQPLGSVLLHFGSGLILGFDDHRGAARSGNQHVGMTACVVDEGLSVLGSDFAAGHHAPQQVAQGVVCIRFRLARHTFPINLSGRRGMAVRKSCPTD